MENAIKKLKFDIAASSNINTAQSLIQSGFIPNGEAKKNGWEEVRDVADNIKTTIHQLYTFILSTARELVNIGAGNERFIIDLYKSIPQDVEITTNSLLAIEAKHINLTGFFKPNNDAILAQEIIIEYYNVFENVRALTSTAMVELTEISNRYNHLRQQQVTDVEIKAA